MVAGVMLLVVFAIVVLLVPSLDKKRLKWDFSRQK
jgi:hypothetical protein